MRMDRKDRERIRDLLLEHLDDSAMSELLPENHTRIPSVTKIGTFGHHTMRGLLTAAMCLEEDDE